MNTQMLNLPMDFENKISFLKTLFSIFPQQFNITDMPTFIETIRNRYNRCVNCRLCPETDTLYSKLNNSFLQHTQISIHTKEAIEIVELCNIIYLEANDNYTIFHLKDGTTSTATINIQEYEFILPYPLFIRVHRSFIINIHHLNKYLIKGKAIMNGVSVMIDVAKPHRKILLSILDKLS